MADQVFVQVRIKENTVYGPFNDALYFTEAQYATVTEKELADLKQARVDAWLDMIENPPPEIPPTKKQLEEVAVILTERLAEIHLKLDPIATKQDLEKQKAELQAVMDKLDEQIGKK